ncbi:MAG TPA: hypothetical protein VNN10_06185 [Dehalococcoidia bacterium]|nr:hypothetical protein [Dehalococcoidia bacterium]
MLDLAKNEAAIADAGDSWNLDPWLLGVENGVVDLRTGRLLEAEPAQGISNSVPVRYDPDAECPRWL